MTENLCIGWLEWFSLPVLGIPAIEAKVDTGARTSSLHAFALDTFTEEGILKVRFGVHPLRKRKDLEIYCIADVMDQRNVMDSGGHSEKRYVISTLLQLGTFKWVAEITLTNRETMAYRMLLGRTAMRTMGLLVNPSVTYIMGKSPTEIYS